MSERVPLSRACPGVSRTRSLVSVSPCPVPYRDTARGHGHGDTLAAVEPGHARLADKRRPASSTTATCTDGARPEQTTLPFEACAAPGIEHCDAGDPTPRVVGFPGEMNAKGALFTRSASMSFVAQSEPSSARALPRGITIRHRKVGPDVYLLSWTDEGGRLRQERAGSDLDAARRRLEGHRRGVEERRRIEEQRERGRASLTPGARVQVVLPLPRHCGPDEEPGTAPATFLCMATGELASSAAVVRFDALPLGWPRAAGRVALVALERVAVRAPRGRVKHRNAARGELCQR